MNACKLSDAKTAFIFMQVNDVCERHDLQRSGLLVTLVGIDKLQNMAAGYPVAMRIPATICDGRNT